MEKIPASPSSSWLIFSSSCWNLCLFVHVWKFVPTVCVDPNGRRSSTTVKKKLENECSDAPFPRLLQGSDHHFTVLQAEALLCGFSLSKMCLKHWHFCCHSYLYSVMTQALEKSCWNYMFHRFNFPLLTREWFALFLFVLLPATAWKHCSVSMLSFTGKAAFFFSFFCSFFFVFLVPKSHGFQCFSLKYFLGSCTFLSYRVQFGADKLLRDSMNIGPTFIYLLLWCCRTILWCLRTMLHSWFP